MIFSTTRNEVNSSADSYPVGYNSTILKEFVGTLERLKDPQTLDVGPVCQENITFFALRMSRHYVCDMFLRLKGQKRKDLLSANGWNHLDFPARTFDGIQLWDLCDHLEDEEVSRLVTLCHTMLRYTGLLMLIAFAAAAFSSFLPKDTPQRNDDAEEERHCSRRKRPKPGRHVRTRTIQAAHRPVGGDVMWRSKVA